MNGEQPVDCPEIENEDACDVVCVSCTIAEVKELVTVIGDRLTTALVTAIIDPDDAFDVIEHIAWSIAHLSAVSDNLDDL